MAHCSWFRFHFHPSDGAWVDNLLIHAEGSQSLLVGFAPMPHSMLYVVFVCVFLCVFVLCVCVCVSVLSSSFSLFCLVLGLLFSSACFYILGRTG